MNHLLLCALLFALPLAACKRKPAPTVTAPEAPAAPPNPAVDLKVLNEAVNSYLMSQPKEPETLDDLVKAKLVLRIPVAPPGKKYALAANRMSVLLVDK